MIYKFNNKNIQATTTNSKHPITFVMLVLFGLLSLISTPYAFVDNSHENSCVGDSCDAEYQPNNVGEDFDESNKQSDCAVKNLDEDSLLVNNYYTRDRSVNIEELADKLKRDGVIAILLPGLTAQESFN